MSSTNLIEEDLTIPSLSWLRILDVIKDNLWHRGGADGDSPFLLLTPRLQQSFDSCRHIGLFRFARTFSRHTAESEYERSFFQKKVSALVGGREKLIPNPKYHSDKAVFWTLTQRSAFSAIYFLLSWLEVVLDFSAGLTTLLLDEDLCEAYEYFSGLSPLCFVSAAKYVTVFPLAKYLKQSDMPEKPAFFNDDFLYFLPGEAFKKWFKNRLRSVNQTNLSFFWSLLQGVKRSTADVPPSFIIKALEKHRKVLLMPPKMKAFREGFESGEHSWDEINEHTSFKEKFSKKIRSLTYSFRFLLNKSRIFEPSTSSSFHTTRGNGGQRAEVAALVGLVDEYPEEFSVFETLRMNPDNGIVSIIKGPIKYLPSNEGRPLLKMIHTTTGFTASMYGVPLPHDFYQQLFKAARREIAMGGGYLRADIVPLSEPLKVRTISKGPAANYYLSKHLQVAMWNFLREFPQFKLIGEPLTNSHLHGILDREKQLATFLVSKKTKLSNTPHQWVSVDEEGYDLGFDQWVSGDYSAATDNLDIDFTMECIDTLMAVALEHAEVQDIPELTEYLQIVRTALNNHVLCYNKSYDLSDPPEFTQFEVDAGINYRAYLQQTGQLMGSPLSFPILCAINLICYWIALETYFGIYIPFKFLPLLVNGDDILFRANSRFYRVWKETIVHVGFQLSLGKNYIHKDILTVNSMLFRFSSGTSTRFQADSYTHLRLSHFKEVQFFNPGLLMAQSKGQVRDKTRRLSFDEMYYKTISGAHNKLRAHKRFIHYNKDRIKEITNNGKFNLFIPTFLGGLGFYLFPEIVPIVQFTSFQRRWASFLLSENLEAFSEGRVNPMAVAALVVSKDVKKTLDAVKVAKAHQPITTAAVGPLQRGQVEYSFEEYFSPVFSGGFRYLNVYFDRKSEDSPIEYRMPDKSLLKRFTKLSRASLIEADRMSDHQLLGFDLGRLILDTSL